MNKYTIREALISDQDFILNLLKSKLSKYHLHEKQLPSSRENLIHRPLDVNEVQIDNVFIVMHDTEKVGAYKFEYDSNGEFYRLFWLASIENGIGLGRFVMDYVKSFAQKQGCETIKLSVNLSNIDAIRCYVKSGFVFEKKYEQEVEMEIKIGHE